MCSTWVELKKLFYKLVSTDFFPLLPFILPHVDFSVFRFFVFQMFCLIFPLFTVNVHCNVYWWCTLYHYIYVYTYMLLCLPLLMRCIYIHMYMDMDPVVSEPQTQVCACNKFVTFPGLRHTIYAIYYIHNKIQYVYMPFGFWTMENGKWKKHLRISIFAGTFFGKSFYICYGCAIHSLHKMYASICMFSGAPSNFSLIAINYAYFNGHWTFGHLDIGWHFTYNGWC